MGLTFYNSFLIAGVCRGLEAEASANGRVGRLLIKLTHSQINKCFRAIGSIIFAI